MDQLFGDALEQVPQFRFRDRFCIEYLARRKIIVTYKKNALRKTLNLEPLTLNTFPSLQRSVGW